MLGERGRRAPQDKSPERASVFSVAGDSGRKGGGERAARQVQRARPSESKEETLTRLTQTGGSSSLDFKRLPITSFLSGAIPITNPITDLHLGRDRNSFPERASVFSVAGDSGRKGGGAEGRKTSPPSATL